MSIFLGLLASFGTAAAKSTSDISTKIASSGLDERPLMAITYATSTTVLIALSLICYPNLIFHPLDQMRILTTSDCGWVLALDGSLNAIASYFYIRAFKYSDASLVAPLMLLTPIFMLVTSPLMLGEHIPPLGVLGIFFAVLGSYRLAKSEKKVGAKSPWHAMFKDRGVRNMLVTVTIWSVTSNLDKIGVVASTPLIWGASVSAVISFYSLLFLLLAPKDGMRFGQPWKAVPAGLGQATQAIMQFTALTLIPVPYVISIKRLSAVFTVLVSGWLLKENTKGRLEGVLIMMIGTALMAFASWKK